MSRAGGVVALVVLIVLAGCTGLADVSSDSSTPTPETTSTATPEPTPTATPEPTPTPTPTPEWDESAVALGVDEPQGAELLAFVNNESLGLRNGEVSIYDEDGTQVESFRLDDDDEWLHTIDGLNPGTNYTLKISDIVDGAHPPVETHFDPGQTDEIEVFTVPDFQQADTFEWDWRYIQGEFVDDESLEPVNQDTLVEAERQLLGGGVYDEGDWELAINEYRALNNPDWANTTAVSIDDEMYHKSMAASWSEIEEYPLHPAYQPSFAPVRDGLFNMENRTLQYVDTRELNDSTVPESLHVQPMPEETEGAEVHVYDILLWGHSDRAGGPYFFDRDSEARIYVDVETGHVLRWAAKNRLSIGMGHFDYYRGMNPSVHVIDFYNHEDEDVEVAPNDYPPFR